MSRVIARNIKPTVLLTLGRLPVSLDLARALKAAGWRVIVAEPFAWHLCRLSNTVHKSFQVEAPSQNSQRYHAQLLDIIHREAVSLVLPVSEESLYVAQLQGQVPDDVRVLCADQSSLLRLHDKYEFARFAQSLELPVPATTLANESLAVAQLLQDPFVIKPRLSCAGVGVRLADGGGELLDDEKDARYIVQRKLNGALRSTFSIASTGKTCLNVCYQSRVESGSVSVCFEQIDMPEEIANYIDVIVAATQYNGMISFDFMQDETGQWQAIECNPRASSGMHFLSPDQLQKALIDGQSVSVTVSNRMAKEFWSCLATLEGKLLKGRLDRAGWRHFFKADDITWQFSDMKPFLLMSFIYLPTLVKAIRTRRPLTELLLQDVGWHAR